MGLVTGGGSGIGAAICRAFTAEGARVAVLDVNETAAARVASELAGAIAVTADVSHRAEVDAAVDQAVAELGGLDILVNNAGIVGRDEVLRSRPRVEAQLAEALAGDVTTALDVTVSLTDDEWRRMLATHLDGTFYCTRAALRVMGPARSGVIINMASICGIIGCTGVPHYSAAKAGILGFTRAVAKEVITQGIRVNAIAPGYIDTPMLELVTEPMRIGVRLQTPIHRLGTPGEIAAAAVFLASDEASFFVGETLSPNGGFVTT